MSEFYHLKFYLRPTSAIPPPSFGPLAIAYHLLRAHPNLNLVVEYEDGLTGAGKDKSCVLTSSDGSTLAIDTLETLKFLARTFSTIEPINGTNDEEKKKIEIILNLFSHLFEPSATKDISIISPVADQIDQHLTLRTYLQGYQISIADWALWGLIKSSSTFAAVLKRSQHVHLARWYNHMDSLDSSLKAVTNLQEEIKNAAKGRSKAGVASVNFDEGLPGAVKGQVVTRFPPEPSGYLHIGHCKAAILNQHYAKIYDGKFIVRFDDTNPSKEKEEFQDAILEDLELLGIKGDMMSYTSDYFDKLYDYAIEMIKKGAAFCDDTEQEAMKAERMARQPSKRRDSSVEENLARFEEMKKGTSEGLRWCLRAKISYDNLNGTLRDPVIYRCNLLPHHRTGEQWKIYPTYDFACPIVDSIEGVSHALRTNEYRDRNPQYWWMQKALGLRKVQIKDFARVNFVYTLLSKRKLKWFVETGRVRGWDDPRFATVRGIRRRGMTIQAMRDFMIGQGDSQVQVNMEWDIVWSINKRIIDPIVPRHTAIMTKNVVKAIISGGKDQFHVETLPAHKKNPDAGTKDTTFGPVIYLEQEDALSFEENEEITLMDWGNAIVRAKMTSKSGVVTEIQLDLHLEGDFKKTKKKVHWLAAVDQASVASKEIGKGLQNVVLLDYDYLITKKKIEEEDEIDDFITPVSEFIDNAIADGNIRKMKKGDILQFERKGYYIVDKPLGETTTLASGSGEDWVELIRIPDGRAAGIASKATPPAPAVVKASRSKKAGDKDAQDSNPTASESTSQMYKVEPIYENEGSVTPMTTKMYAVSSVYQ
ncbi:hypothetical protein CROQUDRAFT_36753 [Cronartium quercuum f. sp. fusiforme G11]|uniref:glutamate--tRNA ligase n=1 Tax=Cronartium quercuum f. sp. fusiforme G11 TaxID=708437 RepID=A0A9P6TG39_9BASI|nr:hypothetical protein CROQUDRAFT_36753 [Cronartium quercuum f. sp. fusiforme G11]